MSVDAFPVSLAEQTMLSVLCQNSLTDAEVKAARAALRSLDPAWTLECCESCESDLFLDLSTTRPAGRYDRYVLHARNGAICVFAMADDAYAPFGEFSDITQAARAVAEAIAASDR